jgi:hypothetical protein
MLATQLTQAGQAQSCAAIHPQTMDDLAFPLGARVRVTADVGEAPEGSVGVVIGFYRREPPAYAVAVRGTPVTIPPTRLQHLDETREQHAR